MEGGPSSQRIKEITTGGIWSLEEKDFHINILELLAVEIGLRTFLRLREVRSVHVRVDNFVALTYLVKMGGTKSKMLCDISHRIWEFLLDQGVSLTASWIPSALNVEADGGSRRKPNSSEWLLNPQVFLRVTKILGYPQIDAFASRIMHLLPSYWSLDPDPEGLAINAMSQDWNRLFLYLFPPFCMLGRVLQKLRLNETERAILIAPIWPGQSWFPFLLEQLIHHPLALPCSRDLLRGPKGEDHSLAVAGSLTLGAFLVSGQLWKTKDYQKRLCPSSSMRRDQERRVLTHRPGLSGVLGVVSGKVIPLIHL